MIPLALASCDQALISYLFGRAGCRKKYAASERVPGDLHQLSAGGEIIGVFRPPGGCEDVAWIVCPLWTRDAIAATEELDGGCAEGFPAAGMFGALFWFC